MNHPFKPGDLVIYRKTKHSTHPGPRAENLHPAPNGDTYSYVVSKFWLVREVLEDGTLVAVTRRGKLNQIRPDDPGLRRPNWFERLFYRSRFSELLQTDAGQRQQQLRAS
ncbi:MAG: hypothetical protein KDA81_03925 [Planctomycetaceae bacterium]|nr:hypothetical protein [Planctomycetaceae bacterium]